MKTFLVVVILLCTGCSSFRERLRIEMALLKYHSEQDQWYRDHKKEVDEFNDLSIP